MTVEQDELFMRAALQEARNGLYFAPPNPAVGCVLVRDGRIIARGFTHAPGSRHAEIDAIENAKAQGIDVRGATAYVTLEPCSHYGRTPPCALRLIDEGIGRVVAAMEDPNPLVAGRGLKMLQDAGVAVTNGVCRDEAYESNIGFFTRMRTGRPWVRLKTAVSLDGRSALSNGESRWITSEEARRRGRLWRARAQGILTGIGTVLSDNPQMSVREEKLPSPFKFVLDSLALTPVTFNILQGQPATIFVGSDAPQSRVEVLEAAGASVVSLPGTRSLDLGAALDYIGGRNQRAARRGGRHALGRAARGRSGRRNRLLHRAGDHGRGVALCAPRPLRAHGSGQPLDVRERGSRRRRRRTRASQTVICNRGPRLLQECRTTSMDN